MNQRNEFEIGDRVRYTDILLESDNPGTGEIVGIASDFPAVMFFILLLDEPVLVKGHAKPWKAIVAPSGNLVKIKEEFEPSLYELTGL